MNRKSVAILVMLAAAFLILLIGFYYGCRSGSESQQVNASPTERTTSGYSVG